MRKEEIFLLSRKDALMLKVLAVRAGKSLDRAIVRFHNNDTVSEARSPPPFLPWSTITLERVSDSKMWEHALENAAMGMVMFTYDPSSGRLVKQRMEDNSGVVP